jgi:hypothetical protein
MDVILVLLHVAVWLHTGPLVSRDTLRRSLHLPNYQHRPQLHTRGRDPGWPGAWLELRSGFGRGLAEQ